MSKPESIVISSGWQRARAVWSTYASRPLVWFWGLSLFAAPWCAWVHLDQLRSAASTGNRPGTPEVNDFHGQHIGVAPGPPVLGQRYLLGIPTHENRSGGTVLLPAEAEMLEIVGDPAATPELWEPGRFPKVRGIWVLQSINDEQLQRLLTLYQPEQLILNQAHQLTTRSWEVLGRSRIKHLDLGWSRVLDDAPALTWPPELQGLTLHQQPSVRRLQELRALPGLVRITLRCEPWNKGLTIPSEIVAELDQFPNRPSLALDTPQGSDGAWAVAASRQFQRLTVRPVFIPRWRVYGAFLALGIVMGSLAIGLIQLSGQGLQAETHLMPGALGPHRGAAALLWLIGMPGPCVLMWSVAVTPFAAFAVCAVAVIIYAAWGRILHRDPTVGATGFAHPIMAVVPMMFLPMIVILFTVGISLVPGIVGEIDWFLRGERPWLATGLCLLAVLSGGWLIGHISTLAYAAARAGLQGIPLSIFDLGKWNQALAPIVSQRLEKQVRWNVFMRIRERRLNTLLDQPPVQTQAQRVRLWLAGYSVHPHELAGLTLAMLCFQVLVFASITSFRNSPSIEQLTLLMPATQGFGMLLIFPVFMFAARRKYLTQELLFPVSRRTWRNDWFLVQVWMLLPATASVLLLPLLSYGLRWLAHPPALAPNAALSPSLLVGLAVGAILGLSLAWVVSLWLGTYTGFRLFLAAAGLCLLIGAGFAIMMLVITLRNETDPSLVTLTLLGGLVLGGWSLLLWLMLRRWEAWEVGRT